MSSQKPTTRSFSLILYQHRFSLGYAIFSLALLVFASLQRSDLVFANLLTSILLGLLAISVLVVSYIFSQVDSAKRQSIALITLALQSLVTLGLVISSGGYQSLLWATLLIPSVAAPLLLSGRMASVILFVIWLGYAGVMALAPSEALVGSLIEWGLRVSGIALVAFMLYRARRAEEDSQRGIKRREKIMHEFLELSNRLRLTSAPNEVLEEILQVLQTSGDFNCVTLCRVNEQNKQAVVELAIGASGRRLNALEGLSFPKDQVAGRFTPDYKIGSSSFFTDVLPFRTLTNEIHVLLPIKNQLIDTQSIVTVSADIQHRAQLEADLPLIEMLANLASASLENNTLYSTMEQRVFEATTAMGRGQEELAIARDRAETLYRIVRTLSVTLDEREVLSQALLLIAQATEAEQGGIMMVEPNTGRLVFRTTLDRKQGGQAVGLERAQGLAGWVIASREISIVPNTAKDSRWQNPSGQKAREQSALVVPMIYEDQPLGVLVLTHSSLDHFRQEHGQLALAANGQIASAYTKAQLYRFTTEQTEQLQHTVQQREEEASKSLAILRSIADGVVVGDRLGRIRMINPAAEQILGIKSEAFIGRQMSELPGVPLDSTLDQIEEMQQLQVDGRTLRAHYAPVVTANNERFGGVVVYHDISREVLADRLKSEFIATASHELRTPLTSIRGYIDLLLLGTLGPLSQAQNDFLKVVKTNVVRLVELIDDLLDVSRAEAGEMRLKRESTDITEVLYEAGEALYTQFTSRSISLAIDVPENLPPVIADRQRLRQIIVNLVNNACKYTPEGGRVDVIVRNEFDKIRIDVRDNGVGIAEGAQEHIFTPFFRADNPLREQAGGTGLGLSITKTLVDLHGGEIWFKSNEGEGSTFSFTLPLGNNDWTPAEWLSDIA